MQRWKQQIVIATLTILSECSAEKDAASYAVWVNEKEAVLRMRILRMYIEMISSRKKMIRDRHFKKNCFNSFLKNHQIEKWKF